MKERLNYIDFMKTSGIYLIVLGHMFPAPGTNFIYSFSVPLFFFISGFLFYQQNNFAAFLIKNLHSLIIPYLFINCISLIFVICFSSSFSWEQSVLTPLLGVLIGANQGKNVCLCHNSTYLVHLHIINSQNKFIFYTLQKENTFLYYLLLH
ncbi:Acyltransferase family protein [Bacteroides clarus YIT 12056]|uniref:acyltransferase family protein n=1 Tax=Bacteroides clarus TaxID=626929 RepID=UPI000920FADA|nr:acyltransferase family protein [Bacteroides clarus]SHH09864.1 Acyltransferase family protein [Bacteroides clarus YIT 12056]